MSWLFSRALVAEYSEASCSGGEPSALLSANPMSQAFLPSDRMMAFSRPSRFGMTFAPLTDGLGAELLTWFLEASRVRTSAQPEKAPGSTASEAGFGEKWRELSVRYDPDTSSWRTHRSLWDEGLPECSVILPRWGLMRNGVCLERMTLALRTAANDAGLLPTPLASNTKAQHMRSGGRPARSYWPTPKANDAEKRGNFDTSNPRNGLPAAAKSWPTPTVNDSKNCTLPPSQVKHDNIPGALLRDGEKTGGQLNPTWVEWLMGWPIGWTDLEPLGTAKCLDAPRRLGAC